MPIVVSVLILGLVDVERVGSSVDLLLLVLIVCLEACVGYSVRLLLEFLTDVRVVRENQVLVVIDAFSVCISSLIVELPLHVFLVLQISLVPVHEGIVIISAVFDLVSKLRVLLSDSNLFLQALLFVVELA